METLVKSQAIFSPAELSKQQATINDLMAKINVAKQAIAASKKQASEAKKALKDAKKSIPQFSRMLAMCETLKANPAGKRKDVCVLADKFYTDKTGEPANVVKTARYYGYAVDAMSVFTVVAKK